MKMSFLNFVITCLDYSNNSTGADDSIRRLQGFSNYLTNQQFLAAFKFLANNRDYLPIVKGEIGDTEVDLTNY